MLVEKEKIIKAKEKLGVQNAEIIREILQIENYDTRNMKGICPFHSENTPSFIFNPKNYSFHCFGCGKKRGHYRCLYAHWKNVFRSCTRVISFGKN